MSSYDYHTYKIYREKPQVTKSRICESCGAEHTFQGKYCLDCKCRIMENRERSSLKKLNSKQRRKGNEWEKIQIGSESC